MRPSSCRPSGTAPAPTRTALTAAALATSVLALGCTAGSAAHDGGIEPVQGTSSRSPANATPHSPSATKPPTTASDPDPAADTDDEPGATTDPGAAATVEEVLARYDRVLTDLSNDPVAAAAPGSPQRLAWDAAVLPGTGLSSELVGRIIERAATDRIVVGPGPDGLAYRHHLDQVSAASATSISFSWCGVAPGVGRDLDSGEVVDDSIAHSTGRGRLDATNGAWRLAAVDELGLRVLPPRTADPC